MASYEIGHGLESAAYLSIGSCARLAILLGLEHKFDGGSNSTSMEEKSRTWWGVVIVERCANNINAPPITLMLCDANIMHSSVFCLWQRTRRHINLAFPHRPLITSDPEANGYLPADDDDKWDDEVRKFPSRLSQKCLYRKKRCFSAGACTILQ
jgi:hypothetical protein